MTTFDGEAYLGDGPDAGGGGTLETLAEEIKAFRRGVAAALNSRDDRTETRLTAFEAKLRSEAADVVGSRMVEIDRRIQQTIGPLADQVAELRGAQHELSGLIRRMLGLDDYPHPLPGLTIPPRLSWWRRWFR